jgi:hypothetical protein
MSRLNIDFAPKRVHLAPRVACVLAAIALSAVGTYGASLEREVSELSYGLGRSNTPVSIDKESRRDESVNSSALTEIQAAANAIAQINRPWLPLLAAIEVATPVNVRLVSLQMDLDARKVGLTAEVNSVDDMFGYVRSLRGKAGFNQASLKRHELKQRDLAASRILFSIELDVPMWMGGNTVEGIAP